MAITDTILNIGGTSPSDKIASAMTAGGKIGRAAANITKKVRGNQGEVSPADIRDLNTNGFLAQNSAFVPGFFSRVFDEPTYLSFRIEFMFDDISNYSRNIAYNNFGVSKDIFYMYDKMYDYMPEPFLDNSSVIGYYKDGEDNKLGPTQQNSDSSYGFKYSTELYLDSQLGDHARAAMLQAFKSALADVQDNFPYYFKSIGGIDTLSTITPSEGIRLKDGKITLSCYEGLDLKITQLMQLYRKIVWDDVYQRWVLPDMMRYFGMRIYVSEVRLFSDVMKEYGSNEGVFDYNSTRNMTYRQPDNRKWDKALTNATAVSNAFLGTKSVISKALNYTTGAINTGLDIVSDFKEALNTTLYCNNAINSIMPTICFECHMCEFDISNTFKHIDNLESTNKNEINPSITIKVGQVKDIQEYPLNKFLKLDPSTGYVQNPNKMSVDSSIIGNFASIHNARQETGSSIGAVANYLSDEGLNKTHISNVNLSARIKEATENIFNKFAVYADADTISLRRYPSGIINKMKGMNYDPSHSTDGNSEMSITGAGLMAAALNEVSSMTNRLRDPNDNVTSTIFGTNSPATDPSFETKKLMKEIGEQINLAAERIYNGSEIKSMAAQGVTEQKRAEIANSSFEAYVRELEQSTATENSLLKEFLKNYRIAQQETTQMNNLHGKSFSEIN